MEIGKITNAKVTIYQGKESLRNGNETTIVTDVHEKLHYQFSGEPSIYIVAEYTED